MKKLLLFSLFTLLASAMGWAATETWVKVTSQDDLTDGEYLIVCESESKAFDGSLTSITKKNTPIDIKISSNTISLDDKYCFTISKTGEAYTIISKSGFQIGTKENKNLSTGSDLTNTIVVNSNKVVITSVQGPENKGKKCVLQYNANANASYFCYYQSPQTAIALYKKQEAKVASLEYSPAFGDIAKGTEITISCATEGAVLSGTFGALTLENQALPYNYTVRELGELKVAVKATQEGLKDSEVLTGTYNVCQPKVAALEINPGFGTIEVGTEITISCATEGAVLNGLIGDTDVTNAPLPYTFTADKEGTISVLLSATKDGYDESELLDNKFIVKAAVPVAYRDVITVEDYTGTSSYTELSLVRTGATYSSKAYQYKNKENICLQFNNNDKQAGIVMKESKAFVSKIIITWNKSGAGFEIYGKNSPYTVAADLYNTTTTGTLIESCAWTKNGDVTEIDLSGKPFTFIGVKPTGVTYINSIEFIWNEGAAGGADVTYTKASEAKAGNFAVLATADGKAVGRNADLTPVNVTVSGDAIGLDKSQADVDEFEIVEKDATNKIYQLCGGLSKSRRFLTYNADGVTTTAATVTKVDGKDVVSTTDANADVTFESTEAGLLIKFKDGQYLMFNGTKFIKADNGGALTPVIVFMSSSNVSTGVETVEFDENAEAQYFNLNGVQVKAENLTPGLYIVRQGNKVSKQVIR